MRSANLLSGFLSKANTNRQGKSPKTVNKIMPGIKKLEKGELSNMDNGIPNN